ncbi:MAG: cupin domain-containing protein, partial [Actinomycetota bacterium]|nr:cupin domain-containing protein [Actinomycetota bacterium]
SEPGVYTPRHSHPFEHENFVVSGSGEVLIEGKKEQVIRGDVVFIPPVLEHQYRNTGKEMLEFLCGIPVERFRKSASGSEED